MTKNNKYSPQPSTQNSRLRSSFNAVAKAFSETFYFGLNKLRRYGVPIGISSFGSLEFHKFMDDELKGKHIRDFRQAVGMEPGDIFEFFKTMIADDVVALGSSCILWGASTVLLVGLFNKAERKFWARKAAKDEIPPPEYA